MDTLLLDLRYAVRTVAKRPAFALAAVLSLAVGIAANTAIFSIVNGVLLKDVPGITRPERLVELSRDADGGWLDMAYPVVRHLREDSPVVEDLAALAMVPASVVAEGEPRVGGGLAVTESYFSLLGLEPFRGRLFTPAEATHPSVAPVAVVSHHLWTHELGAVDDVIGRSIRVNGFPVRVVGVLAPGFAGHHAGLRLDVFLPLGLAAPGLPRPESLDQPQSGVVEVLGRLRPGVRRGAAAEALSVAAEGFLQARAPDPEAGRYVVRVDSWSPLPGPVRGGIAAFLGVLSLLVGLALAMACMNVTTMLLARGMERRSEIAVRRALGADRLRLCRQLVTEALVLFAAAGLAGGALAVWATGVLGSFSPQLPIPGRVGFDFGLDGRVLAFSLIVTLGAGVLFSLVPGLRAGSFSLVPALRDGPGGASPSHLRWRRGLVGFQVGVTALLMVAAALFTGSLTRSRQLDAGWKVENVLVVDLDLELRGADSAAGRVFFGALLERLRGLPDIEAAALAAKLPLAGCSSFGGVHVPGVEPPRRHGFDACLNRVSPGYFRTLDLPLLRGRDFADQDGRGSPRVAVVNESMADRLWPDGDAVGREFYLRAVEPRNAIRVVGVVADAKYHRLDEEAPSFYYVPAAQWFNSRMVLHARTAPGAGGGVAAAIRSAISELDPYLPAASPRPLSEALELFFLPQRLAAWVAAVMGSFALLLAAVGVYGVAAFVVSGQAREIGIRLALGAQRGDVLRLVLRQGSLTPAIGLAAGIGVGFLFAHFVRDVIAGVNPLDPVAFGGVPLIILIVAATAILLPVWRLLRQDPLRSLRAD